MPFYEEPDPYAAEPEDERQRRAERERAAEAEAYFRQNTGGTQEEAYDFITRHPGDTERLYAPWSGGQSVFTNRPGASGAPPTAAGTPPPGSTPPPGGTQPSGGGQPPPGGPFAPVAGGGGGGDDNQQRLIEQLTGRFGRGFQPDQQYGADVMRLMQAQEGRATEEAKRRAAFEENLRTTLMDLIRRGQEPISAEQTPEAKAFARVRERAMQRYRAQQAEQRAAQGIGQTQRGEVSGALASDIQSGETELAEQIAGFESRLIADQINRRRAELMQALQLGAGIMSGDQQNAIRRELAQLDTALKRELAHADLGLREFLGGGQLSLGLLGALQQNSQFYDRLGYDVGLSEAMLNQNATNQLFGGYQLR